MLTSAPFSPLRRHQVIIRERLRFPSGFSTAVLISVLHKQKGASSQHRIDEAAKGGFASLVPRDEDSPPSQDSPEVPAGEEDEEPDLAKTDWAANMKLLLLCFLVSGIYTVCTYFVPMLRNIPIFGTVAAHMWLWTLNPSLAYVGQGIIMGAETTLHMTLGAVVGWGILSPLAKGKGWAPGPVDDWEHGSKGWIVWISLAIMLVDAVVSLAYIALSPVLGERANRILETLQQRASRSRVMTFLRGESHTYSLLPDSDHTETTVSQLLDEPDATDAIESHNSDDTDANEGPDDAPPEQRIGGKTVSVGFVVSVLICIFTIHIVFGDLVPLYATVMAVAMALVLSIMGVRALGETDLNPVSGISKLAQLFFALIIPQSNKSSVLINLVAGAVVRVSRLDRTSMVCRADT